jgi:hypothetical protein
MSAPDVTRARRPGGTATAARARKARARRRQGLTIFHVEAHENRLAEALIEANRLTEGETLRRPLIERELARLVEDWCQRWLEAKKRHA